MPLTLEQVQNLVNLTRKKSEHGRIIDLSSNLQDHVAYKQLLSRMKKKEANGSYKYQFQVLLGGNGSFRAVGLDTPDSPVIVNNTTNGEVELRMTNGNWAVDVRVVDANKGSEEQLYDYMTTQRLAGEIAQVETMERWFWGLTASTDTVTPYGLPNLIVKNNTEGFNGTVPSGYTTCMNINPSTYTRFKNWTAQYTNPTQADLGAKLKKAFDMTGFKSPVQGINKYNGDKIDRGIYTTWQGREYVKDLCMAQNEDLGMDIDPIQGPVMRRIPFVWVPTICPTSDSVNGDTTHPYYGIDWNTVKISYLNGWWMYEKPGQVAADDHNKVIHYTDTIYNLMIMNKRSNFVIATNTTGVYNNSSTGYPANIDG